MRVNLMHFKFVCFLVIFGGGGIPGGGESSREIAYKAVGLYKRIGILHSSVQASNAYLNRDFCCEFVSLVNYSTE